MGRLESEGVPAPAPIEQRWSAASTACMSPSSPPPGAPANTVASWVGVIMYLPAHEHDHADAMRNKITARYRRAPHLLSLFLSLLLCIFLLASPPPALLPFPSSPLSSPCPFPPQSLATLSHACLLPACALQLSLVRRPAACSGGFCWFEVGIAALEWPPLSHPISMAPYPILMAPEARRTEMTGSKSSGASCSVPGLPLLKRPAGSRDAWF